MNFDKSILKRSLKLFFINSCSLAIILITAAQHNWREIDMRDKSEERWKLCERQKIPQEMAVASLGLPGRVFVPIGLPHQWCTRAAQLVAHRAALAARLTS